MKRISLFATMVLFLFAGLASGQLGVEGHVRDTAGRGMGGVIVTAILDPGFDGIITTYTSSGEGRYYLSLDSGWTGIIKMDYPGYEFGSPAGCGHVLTPRTTYFACDWIGEVITYTVYVLTTPATPNAIIGFSTGGSCITDSEGYCARVINFGPGNVTIRPVRVGIRFTPDSIRINLNTWEANLPQYPTCDESNPRGCWDFWMWLNERDTILTFTADVVDVVHQKVVFQSSTLPRSWGLNYDIMGRVSRNMSGVLVRSGKLIIKREHP